jgi:hypothetical protein
MDLCFVERPEILKELEARVPADACFIGMTWEARRALRQSRRRLLDARAILAGARESVLAEAWRLSTSWHRDAAGRDVTMHGGLSLGEAHFMPVWMFILLPAVKNLCFARGARREAGTGAVWCDARAPFFLRASLDVLSKEGGDPFPLTFVGSAAPGAPGAMEESLGPTKAWRPPKRSFRRDVLLRKLFNGLAAVAGIGRRSGRPRLLAGYYPTLRVLFEALASPAWASRFHVDMLAWPPRSLALSYMGRGFPVADSPLRAPDSSERAAAGDILSGWRKVRASAEWAERFRVEGVSLVPVAAEALDAYMAGNIAESVAMVSRAERLLRDGRHKALLIPFDTMPYERILAETARRRGVASVTVSHGIGFVNRYVDTGFHTDYVTVEGPRSKEPYAAAGRAPGTAWEGCGGIFDAYGARRPEPPVGLKRRVLVLTNPPVLFLPDGGPGESEEYLLNVLSVLDGFPDLEVSVKLHPSESLDHFKRVMAAAARPRPLLKNESMADLIGAHGVVIGGASTALVEAAVQNRWAVSVNFFDAPFPPPYDGKSGMDAVRTPDELRTLLARILAPEAAWPDYGVLRRDFCGPLDGLQSARLLERVRDL